MKNTLTFLALLLSIPLLALAQPRWSGLPQRHATPTLPDYVARNAPSSAKISEHNDLPALAYEFSWNDSMAAWDSTRRKTYTYSPAGLLLEAVGDVYTSNAFQRSYRETLSYNVQGWLTDYLSKYWDGSTWVNQSRNEYDYDAFGNSSYDFYFSWNGTTWDSTYGRRSTFSYVFTDKIGKETVEYWDPQNPIWVLSDRSDYHWPNAQAWDSLTYFEYTGTWEPSGRIAVFGWHNFAAELPDSALIQSYSVNGWVDDESMHVTYGLHDSYDWIYYSRFVNIWIPYSREVTQRDSKDHDVLNEGFEWNGGWDQNYGYTNDYLYDGQGRTMEIVHDAWDLGSYSHSQREVFPSFFTGSTDAIAPRVGVTAFPNPCTDRLNFNVELRQNGPVQIALYDLQGRVRVQTASPRLVDSQVEMPISEVLENGTYLYRVSTKEGVASGKVVVQR
jgi:Secretion system C-terminal sorting domain